MIAGLGGNDVINGGGGNDTICGGAGNDTIAGGGGNDKAAGGPGNDTLTGGLGKDTLVGGPGRDKATGGLGKDTCSAETRTTLLSGSDRDARTPRRARASRRLLDPPAESRPTRHLCRLERLAELLQPGSPSG